MRWDLDVEMDMSIEVDSETVTEYGANLGINVPLSEYRERHLINVFRDILERNLRLGSPLDKMDVRISIRDINSVFSMYDSANLVSLWDVNANLNVSVTISPSEFAEYVSSYYREDVDPNDLSDSDSRAVWLEILSDELGGRGESLKELEVILFPVDVRSAVRTR